MSVRELQVITADKPSRVFVVFCLMWIIFTTSGATASVPDSAKIAAGLDTVKSRPCPGIPTIVDHQGNIYHTILIGQQCWMRENMRCTTSPTGKRWTKLTGTTASTYFPYYVMSTYTQYGVLYNWAAAVDTFAGNRIDNLFNGYRRGICPKGWHIPTNGDWTILINYLGGDKEAGKKMKSTSSYWSDAKGFRNTNTSGFSALPAGSYYGGFSYVGMSAIFWSSTRYNGEYAYGRYLNLGNNCSNNVDNKGNAFSVRCKKN